MSWYNPLSWGGDVTENILENIGDAIEDVAKWAVRNPGKVAKISAGTLGVIGAYHAVREAGRETGREAGKVVAELIRPTEDDK